MPKRPDKAVEPVYPTQCPSCGLDGIDPLTTLTLSSIETFDDEEYVVTGTAMLLYCTHGPCQNCGSMFELLRRTIPFTCVGLSCSRCGRTTNLRCRIRKMQTGQRSVAFSAVVDCQACGASRTFKKRLTELWKTLKITLGVPGVISVEKVAQTTKP